MTALAQSLADLARSEGWGSTIEGLTRLSGGAMHETWRFVAVGAGAPLPLILRRGDVAVTDGGLGVHAEADVIDRAAAAGVPAPAVLARTADGIVMQCIEGETLGRRIAAGDAFASARTGLARRCGEVLAKLHAAGAAGLGLRAADGEAETIRLRAVLARLGVARPVFEAALVWLDDHRPLPPDRLVLVHGDFRNGNLIVGEQGLAAVIDWEGAHLGDPVEDLAWICVNAWRFGVIGKPVGGFGDIEDLFAGYGAPVDPARFKFWLVLGTLKWGLIAAANLETFDPDGERAVEKGMIARRASETELDLLRLIAPRNADVR